MRLRRSSAFTLVELLVSMAVLLIIIVGVIALVGGVSGTTTAARRHLSSDNEARRVFDRMASDFARMVKRADADTVFASVKGSSQGGNDKMFFFSEAPAYYDTTGLAAPTPAQGTPGLIGYRIPNDNSNASVTSTRWQLERLGRGLTWDGQSSQATSSGNYGVPGGMVFLSYPEPSPAPAPSPTPYPASTLVGAWPGSLGTAPNFDDGVDANYHVLSGDVFRLEYCFALKTPTTTSKYTTTLTPGKGFSEVSAIIVAIALLDAQGRALLPPGVSLNTLAVALPDPDFTTPPPQPLMAELWAAKLNARNAAANFSAPPGLVSQIRVYQRTFPLNTP